MTQDPDTLFVGVLRHLAGHDARDLGGGRSEAEADGSHRHPTPVTAGPSKGREPQKCQHWTRSARTGSDTASRNSSSLCSSNDAARMT